MAAKRKTKTIKGWVAVDKRGHPIEAIYGHVSLITRKSYMPDSFLNDNDRLVRATLVLEVE